MNGVTCIYEGDSLFVVVMSVGSEYKHKHGIIEDAVNQAVLFGDAPAPTSLRLSFQRFWMTSLKPSHGRYFVAK